MTALVAVLAVGGIRPAIRVVTHLPTYLLEPLYDKYCITGAPLSGCARFGRSPEYPASRPVSCATGMLTRAGAGVLSTPGPWPDPPRSGRAPAPDGGRVRRAPVPFPGADGALPRRGQRPGAAAADHRLADAGRAGQTWYRQNPLPRRPGSRRARMRIRFRRSAVTTSARCLRLAAGGGVTGTRICVLPRGRHTAGPLARKKQLPEDRQGRAAWRAWTPRELRHSFVSILSAHYVRLEDISDLVRHSSTAVTETVYRHEIRPVLAKGATAMNRILKARVWLHRQHLELQILDH